MTRAVRDFLDACVRGRLNILISGGTGVGQDDDAERAVRSFIPDRRADRHDRGRRRAAAAPGPRAAAGVPTGRTSRARGEITIRDLVRNALRMRPDRIVVGEVRDGAALDMLQAMNTGHDGSITTVHANSPARLAVPARDDGADGRRRRCRSGRSASRSPARST